ncbi:MAG: hypothetical protein L0Z46_02695 [Nitrospiraceae bacterium]|nr:hypothetical protein [Nitrospiraceae bacterium]
MEDDREDDKLIHVDLDEETVAHYERRSEAAGRTLEAQLLYELEVNHGLALPDPGDVEATQRGQIFRRISTRRILQG